MSTPIQNLYFPLVKVVLTQWASDLGPAETLVLLFVIDRTVRFGKRYEAITLTHFIEGVHSRDGEIIHAGCGLKRTAIKQALRKLIYKGLVIPDERYTRGAWSGVRMGVDIPLLSSRMPEVISTGARQIRVRRRRTQ